MGNLMEPTLFHHVCIVLFSLWLLDSYNFCHPVAYVLAFIYLYQVHEFYVMKLRRKVQSEERKQSNQTRVLSEFETVRWLNYSIEKIWLVCIEKIVSQKILLPVVPWFLRKYKPWTVNDAVVQHLYLGKSAPIFTKMRVLRECNGDDHLVLELGMNFRTADDMSAKLAVKVRKELGFGMWAKLHLVGMHIEGKVLIGVQFITRWPFLGRLRVCFAEPPYFQMAVKPILSHGLDVTELPGIAGWIDNLLAIAFKQTLVQPNMLVVDVEKVSSPQQENESSADVDEPVAYAIVEVLEAADIKPPELNGLADSYVEVQLFPYSFRTETHRKNLVPKWYEEFEIPIDTWESPNVLSIEVHNKDPLVENVLGYCSVKIDDLRDGKRHDMWLFLENVKGGRLHLAVTVSENSAQNTDLDEFEPVDIEGQKDTGVWIYRPGREVKPAWVPRKGKSRHLETHHLDSRQLRGEGSYPIRSPPSTSSPSGSSSSDGSVDANKPENPIRKCIRKLKLAFHRPTRTADKSRCPVEPQSSPPHNSSALNNKETDKELIPEDAKIAAPYSSEAPKDVDKEDGKRLSHFQEEMSKAEPGLTLSDNDNAQCEPVNDSSLPSATDVPLDVNGSVVSGAATCPGNNSFKSNNDIDQIEAEDLSDSNSFEFKDDAVQVQDKPEVTDVEQVRKIVSEDMN